MSVFSIFRQNSKIEDREKEISLYDYYGRLARRASFAKWTLIALLILFVLYAFSFRGNELSAENFRYALNFLSVDSGSSAQNGAQIVFDYDTENKGASLRNAFSIANRSGVNIYDLSGNKLFSTVCRYDNPVIVSNSKYVILYDLGGNEMQIYSSYSNVKTIKYDYPIYSVVTNDSGMIAVITSERSYRSAFYVYDSYFRVVYYHYFGEQYLLSIALNDTGTKAATACLLPNKTDYSTVVTEFNLKSEKIINTFDVEDEYPMEINYASDDTLSLFTNKTIRRYNDERKQSSKISFSKKDVSCYLFDSKYDIITYSSSSLNSNSMLTVYREDGKSIFTKDFAKGIIDILIKGNTLYVLTYKTLYMIDLENTDNIHSTAVDEDVFSLINSEKDYIFLLSPKKATVFFTQTNENDN